MTLFVLHVLSCAFMTGLIWTVQLLLYPAFAFVDDKNFSQFHNRHSRVISNIVAPVMMLELATGIMLFIQASSDLLFLINLIILIMIWGCTAFLSVPIHNRLSHNWSSVQVKKLILTNWPRTILWSLRLILLAYLFLNNLN